MKIVFLLRLLYSIKSFLGSSLEVGIIWKILRVSNYIFNNQISEFEMEISCTRTTNSLMEVQVWLN